MDTSQVILIAVLVLLAGGIIAIAVIKRYRKRRLLEIPAALEGVQSGLSSILGLIIATAVTFAFDYWSQSRIGNNSYAYILGGLVTGIAGFFIVRENYVSVWFAPLILNLLLIIGLMTDTDIYMLYGLILGLAGAILGYWLGKRKYFAE